MNRLRPVVAILLTFLGPAACAVPLSYSADPIAARVIDAETKQPIAGAVIVATWVLEGGLHHGRIEALVVKEAVTDVEGRFQLPGWGPVARPSSGYLVSLDPEMVIVKSGYLLGVANNYGDSSFSQRVGLWVRDSVWNNRDIELIQHKGNKTRYGDRFAQIFSRLTVVYDSPDCKWKLIPRAVRAFEAEREYQIKGLGEKVSPVESFDRLTKEPKCQPIDQFLKTYRETQ